MKTYLTVKYDAAGVFKWTAPPIYNGGGANPGSQAVAIALSGADVYITDTSFQTSTAQDIATIRYLDNGMSATPVWVVRYNAFSNSDYAAGLAADTTGAYVVGCGGEMTDGTKSDIITVKYARTNGSPVWTKRYDFADPARTPANNVSTEVASSILLDGAGSVNVLELRDVVNLERDAIVLINTLRQMEAMPRGQTRVVTALACGSPTRVPPVRFGPASASVWIPILASRRSSPWQKSMEGPHWQNFARTEVCVARSISRPRTISALRQWASFRPQATFL